MSHSAKAMRRVYELFKIAVRWAYQWRIYE